MNAATEHDRTIQSIRVAASLNQRFRQLANKGYANFEDLSADLGEARQLYPTMWSHLDDARDALERGGTSVGDYDYLRTLEPPGRPGVLGVDTHEGFNSFTKTWSLNVHGSQIASEATKVLRAALPDVDWASMERADAQLAQTDLVPRSRKMLFASVIAGAAIVLIFVAKFLIENAIANS